MAFFSKGSTKSTWAENGCFQLGNLQGMLVARKTLFLTLWLRMKLILAIIQPTKLESVREALRQIGVTRMSVCDATGFARQRGQQETYRGAEYETNLLRKIQLEIAVNDDFVERTIECLEQASRTGQEGTIGDGKIFVLPICETVQVSDAQRGPGAI